MRIFLYIINGLGTGSLPDYSKFDTVYNCTALNIKCIDELFTLKRLGLLKCCLKDLSSNTIGDYFRGRMLSNNVTFDGGLKEILGNVTFDNNAPIKENLITILKKYNVPVCFASSRETSEADNIYLDDMTLLGEFDKSDVKGDSVYIAELHDFAKFGLSGDIQNMEKSIKYLDKYFESKIDSANNDDVLFICGNYGINPSKIGITREYNPIFVYNKMVRGNSNLRTIQGNNAVAMTIVDLLGVYPNSSSFLDDKSRDKILNFNTLVKNEKKANVFEKNSDRQRVKDRKEKNNDESKIVKIRKIVKKSDKN